MATSILLACFCITPPPVLGCINTTYSRNDEVEITNDLAQLIIGAFAHHGPAFYEAEVKRCIAILEKDPNNFDARNDLGAAFTKLGEFDEALNAFQTNEKLHPGKYKTASNLGVMYKKKGTYPAAAKYIEKALKIKPGGHMGLGDYYLKMIKFLETPPETLPTSNFLGVRYDAGIEASAKAANREFVITLIKNDYKFYDAYLVLGDILFTEGDMQLALRAYYRASQLASEREIRNYYTVVRKRNERIREYWAKSKQRGYVTEHDFGHEQMYKEVNAAEEWLETYQAIEKQQLAMGEPVDFARMKQVVAAQGHRKPRILEAAHYAGTSSEVGQRVLPLGVMIIIGFLILFAVFAALAMIVIIAIRRNRPRAYAMSGK